ncbi:MAG: hypothetical protein RR370_02935 [Synergistaceae bacterium]
MNATIKAYQKLDECLNSITAAFKAQTSHDEITTLRNKIEDIYSKI